MKILPIIGAATLAGGLFLACNKPSPGYLSKVLVYNPKTINATKGRVTTSAALIVDGSTSPINVELLGTRNFYTKQPANDILLKKFEIPVYKAEITQFDTTLAQIAPKLGTASYPVFNINSIGGRMEISPASTFVDTGTYEFDIRVTNPAGSREALSVGVVRFVNAANPFEITRQAATSTPSNAETPETAQANVTTTITRTAGPNRIILRFLDKNGAAFNPKTQLIPRDADRPVFRNYAGYYPEEKTDTALVYQYPEKLPTFPLFQYSSVSSVNGGVTNRGYVSFYRIPFAANDLNVNVNPEIGFRLWPIPGEASVSGTFTVTMRLNFVARK